MSSTVSRYFKSLQKPEWAKEFPVVLTVFLALGAWRISQKQVLTRRVPAIETLGSATVLCVDKTGTLTLNQMSVSKLFSHGKFYDVRKTGASPMPPVSCSSNRC